MKNVPYVLTFGQCPRIGISNLPVDPCILDSLHTKAELNTVANFNPVNETPVIERTSRSLNPEIETPVIETPVIEAPAIETHCCLDTLVIDNLESYTSDFAVENIKDNHGKEAPKENMMVRKQCLCYCHSGDNSNCGLHTYNPIWNQTSPMCMELEPR